jgi:uncharacterized protein (TIGR03437 family)
MSRSALVSAAIAAAFTFGFTCSAQVLNPSSLTILPPQQNSTGVYFGTNQPSALHTLRGTDVFFRDASGVIHQLTTVSSTGDSVLDYGVSDDGSLLAYTTAQTEGVFVLTTATGNIVNIPTPSACPGGMCPLGRLHFSSDNRYLLFNVTQAPSNETPSWGWPLYVVELYTRKQVMLAKGELNESGQRVVSDAGKVIFDSSNPGSTIAEPEPPVNIYTINLDGNDLKQLTDYGTALANVASAASIDKAGSLITFQTEVPFNGSTTSEVYRSGSDGVAPVSLGPPGAFCSDPSLSASGTQIAFLCGSGDLYLGAPFGFADPDIVSSFRYSAIGNLVIDETTNELLFTSGPTDPYRYGELGAVFGIELASGQLDKVQFERHLSDIENADLASALSPVPGGVITVQASNLRSNSFVQATTIPLPDTLATASLLVNGKEAPIFSVGPWSLTAQLPWNVPAGIASFQLLFADGEKSQLIEEKVALNSPWLEGFAATNNFGCQAAAYHHGTTELANQTNPAKIGETIDLITSGLGPTNPAAPTGVPTPSGTVYPITGTLNVYLNSMLSELNSAVLDPSTFGQYRVSVVVPAVTNPEVQATLQLDGEGLTSNSCIFYTTVP